MNRRHFLGTAAAAIASSPLRLFASSPTGARFRTAICAYSFREALKAKTMTYDDLVRLAVETGVDGLDLTVYWFPDTSDEFLLPLRRLAYKSGVHIYSLSIRTDMCQPTPELRDKELGEIRKWVDAAQKLGATHIRVFGGKVPKESTEDEAAGWVVETLKRGAEYAGARGIILGIENHGGITEKGSRVVEIVKRVDSPWVGINLDTGNFQSRVWEQIELCLPYAVNVQIKSEMRHDDGTRGPSDWNHVFQLFARYGYKGYIAIEYEAKEDPAVAVPRECKRLRELARKYSTV